MSPAEMKAMEARLDALFQHHIEELRKEFVTKSEFFPYVTKIEKHDEAYKDYVQGKKWILRLGIATLLSAALSPHLAAIMQFLKNLI